MPQPPARDPFAFDRAKISRGQKASMSPVLKILLCVVGGVFLLCAGVFGFALLQGVYQGFQEGQARARNAPPGSSAGEAAFRAANSQITSRGSDGTSAWGNSDEARQLARDFSIRIRALREVYFTKRKKKALVSLSDGEFLTYCHLDGAACVFLVHVPDLRKFTADAKSGLADLAWATAQDVVRSNLKIPPPQLAIGTRGAMLYGHVLIGEFQPNEEDDDRGVEVRQSGDHPEYQLYQFFSPQVVPQTPASAGQSTAGDMPAEDETETMPDSAESPENNAAPDAKVDEPEAVKSSEDNAASDATEEKPQVVNSPEGNTAPGTKEDKPEVVTPPDDKAAPRAKKKKEDRQTRKTDPSSQRETRNAERKKRSDEKMATSKLQMAETFRQFGDLATYRKRLQEIVDKYPETEAGKKAAELLE